MALPSAHDACDASRAAGSALSRAILLYVEGKWASRLPQLVDIVATSGPRERVGAVLLLAQVHLRRISA